MIVVDLTLVLAALAAALISFVAIGWAQPAAERWSYRHDKDL